MHEYKRVSSAVVLFTDEQGMIDNFIEQNGTEGLSSHPKQAGYYQAVAATLAEQVQALAKIIEEMEND